MQFGMPTFMRTTPMSAVPRGRTARVSAVLGGTAYHKLSELILARGLECGAPDVNCEAGGDESQ